MISLTIFAFALIAFVFQIIKYSFFYDKILVHTYLMLMTFSPIVLVVIFNHYGKTELARYFFIVHNICLNVFWVIMMGNDANIAYSFLIFPIPIAILFNKLKKQIILVSITWLAFIACWYIDMNYQPILKESANINFGIISFSIWLTISFLMIRIFVYEIYLAEQSISDKNKELEQFTRVASHDMKEPIRTIASYSSLIKLKYENSISPSFDSYIDFINNSAKRLSILLDDLLIYTTIKDTDETITIVDLNIVYDEVLKNLNTLIVENNVRTSSTELPVVYAFKTRMIQLFQNLISNSIKFQPNNPNHLPKIVLSYTKDESYYNIKFEDNGIGIPLEHQKNVFENFYRIHNKQTYEGSGLGLGTCKRIVDLHNGKIEISSSQNTGTIISVFLPVNKTATL